MAEENQLAGNLLQTQEEADRKAAAQGQSPANTQPVYNPLLGISQREFMQMMAGNDPAKPMVTTDANGVPQFNLANIGQNTPTKVNVNQYGTVSVPAAEEAMRRNVEQISEELTDFYAAFAPELAKDTMRSSYFNEILQGAGNFVSESGKSAGSIIMHSVHGALAQNRNWQEAKWSFNVAEHADDPDFQMAGAQVKQWEDAGYSGQAISNIDVEDLDLSEKSKNYLKEYQDLVSARIADERRMRIAMAYEQDKTNIQDAMQNSKYLTWVKPYGGDEDTAINTIAKMSGQVAGSVAVFYLTGRIAGLTGASIGRAKTMISGVNAAQKAKNAVTLAQAGGTDAFLTAAATIGERAVFVPSFMTQYDSIRTQALMSGKSIAQANAIGFVAGVAEGTAEMLGFKWGRRFYSDGGWFKNYVLRNIVPEAAQEGVQTAAENTITQLTGVTDKQWEDVMSEIGLSIVAGALGGGMFSFWRAKELGLEAKVADIAEELGNKWRGLNKEQINQVVEVTNAAMQATEKEGKDTTKSEIVFSKKGKDSVDYQKQFAAMSTEQKDAANDYLQAVNELKEHYTTRVKEINPNITEAQLRNGWNHVRAQVALQKDINALVSTYQNAINQAVAYLKPDSNLVKSNTKEISDSLFAVGYTQEQINRLTSNDALEAHKAQWEEAINFTKKQAQRVGIGEAEATLIANSIKSIAYDATLVSPNSDPKTIVQKVTDHLINVQVALLLGQQDQLPAIFRNILSDIKIDNFYRMNVQDKQRLAMSIVSSLNAKEMDESVAVENANILFGNNQDAEKKMNTLRNSLSAQAELVGTVLKHMPLRVTSKILEDNPSLQTMTLMHFMGRTSWEEILPAFGIGKNTQANLDDIFPEVAKQYFNELTSEQISHLDVIADDATTITPITSGKTEDQIQYGTGLYSSSEDQAVLTSPKAGTALHETNHYSLTSLVKDAIKLERAGLLSDTSPIHRAYAYLRQAAQSEGIELTEQQIQETLNDAVNDILVNGLTNDPVLTGLLNELKAKGLKRYEQLAGSKYSQKGGKGALSAEQKASLQDIAANMIAGTSPGTMLQEAYTFHNEININGEETEVNEEGLRKIGDKILQFAAKYPAFVQPNKAFIDMMVSKGDFLGLLSLANSLADSVIETATNSFIEYKSSNSDVSSEEESENSIMFEADAAVIQNDPGFRSSFRKNKTIPEALQDVKFSNITTLVGKTGRHFAQSLEGAAGEFDDALKARGIEGAKRGELRSIIMRPFYEYGKNLQEWRKTAKVWADAMDKHFEKLTGVSHAEETLEWYKKFMLPLRQGKSGAYKKAGDFLESKLGKAARESFDNSLKKLEEAKQLMIAKGVNAELFAVGGDFFPFAIKNFDAFVTEFLGHSHAFSKSEKERQRFIDEFKKQHPEENKDNIARLYVQLVDNQNALFQRNADTETKVTSFHHRNVAMADDEDPRIFEYYEDPIDTLDNYMEAAYRTVMMRELIGKTVYTEDGTPILMSDPDSTGTGKIGAYLVRVPYGAVPKEIQDNLLEKLRFLASRDAGDKNTFFDIVRQINQCTTLGSFFNAMNQVMDIPFILTMYGHQAVSDALADMFDKAGKSITLEDVGAETANEVFRVQKDDALKKINKAVFKWSGFAWTDKKIKELALNAAAKWGQDVLKEQNSGSDNRVLANAQRYAELKYIVDECFPEFDINMVPPGISEKQVQEEVSRRNQRRNDLMNALANGGKDENGEWSDDAKFVYWYMLTKLQPINAATVAANYNKVGAFGKNMYQFSTVAMRQLGFLADYWKMKYRTGGSKKAIVGMLQFVAFSMAIGVPKEIIEAVLKGRTPDVGSSFVMSPFHVFMINEYTLNLAKKEGIATAGFKTFGGKFALADNVSKDIITVLSGKDFKFNTSKNVPLIGSLMYAWLFGGHQQTLRQDRDLFGRTQDPAAARARKEANRQKADSTNFLESVF